MWLDWTICQLFLIDYYFCHHFPKSVQNGTRIAVDCDEDDENSKKAASNSGNLLDFDDVNAYKKPAAAPSAVKASMVMELIYHDYIFIEWSVFIVPYDI